MGIERRPRLHWSPAYSSVAEGAGTMKFGHQFTQIIEATHPNISDQFLCYKKLKKCLNNIPEKTEPVTNADATLKPGEKRKLTEEQRIFVKTLNAELQKFNKFFSF